MLHRICSLASVSLLVALAPAAYAWQFDLPTDFELVPISPGLKSPVDVEFAPDGTLFIAEKRGTVRIYANATLQSAPFIDLQDEVNNWGDRGLLGLAHHPGFAADGGATSWVYLLYTVSPEPGVDQSYNQGNKYSFSRLTRYRAETVDGDVVADLASRQILLGNQLPSGAVPDCIASIHESHSNGSIVFGTDGSLLITTGDGAHWDFPDTGGFDTGAFDDFTHPQTLLLGPTPAVQDSGSFRAQDLRSLSGKVLRIDPETGDGYPSNPFYDGDPTSNASRVFALGLRSPFRMTLRPGTGVSDPAFGQPGEFYVGDVGNATWEEINIVRGSENFGWPCEEGPFPHAPFDTFSHGSNPDSLPDCVSGNPGNPTGPWIGVHHSLGVGTSVAAIYLDDADQVITGGFVGKSVISGAFYSSGSYPSEYDGLLFLADYSDDWIKTVELDGLGQPVAVRDFASIEKVVDVAVHPSNGDLFVCNLKGNGQVYHLRHALNLSPTAVALASPEFGDSPLTVDFDGTTSTDPDLDPLTYQWDFGDGSPTSSAATPQHTYNLDGVYEVTLEVTDPGGLSDFDEIQIVVANQAPTVQITSPETGAAFEAPELVTITASAADAEDSTLDWNWTVDQYHNSHVHLDYGSSTQEGSFDLQVDVHGLQTDLIYYRVQVEVTDSSGLSATDDIYLLPKFNIRDVTGAANGIAKVFELVPPVPQGSGNPDFEVLRDGVFPPVGSVGANNWFDTSHGGDQGTDDWIGWELLLPFTDDFRFVGLDFQEGPHLADGGWFETLGVEVRKDGVWTNVTGLELDVPYPFADDGISFESYAMRFDPASGDALRLRGDPGGSTGYLSAGELRVFAIHKKQVPPDGTRDITPEGVFIAHVFDLDPPNPTGSGSLDPATVTNGTTPQVGSNSAWAQYDTYHDGDQVEDWIGLSFPTSKSMTRLLYQEGLNQAEGGWFDSVVLEVRGKGELDWTPVTGLTTTPPIPGTVDPAFSYETFDFDFDTVVAREFRLRGPVGGTVGYVSAGEFSLFVEANEDCGYFPYATGGIEPAIGSSPLAMDSYGIPSLGANNVMEVVGIGEPGIVFIVVGPLAADIPLGTDAILVNPAFGTVIEPFLTDAAGELELPLFVHDDPLWLGVTLYWQAFGLAVLDPYTLLFSNGLQQTFCP